MSIETSLSRQPSGTGAPHVLVMGEDAARTMFLCQSLASRAFVCTGVVGSGRAFDAVRLSEVDAVLVTAPGESTREALRLASRLRDEAEDVGIVLACPSRSLADLAQALGLGVVDYLCEPLTIDMLASAITRAVEWGAAARLCRSARGGARDVEREAVDFLVRQLSEARSSLSLDRAVERLHASDMAGLDRARRVAGTSAAIASVVRIGEPLLGDIWRAGLLRDIGALAVPGVFARSERLAPAGADIDRLRARTGTDALLRVPFLVPAAPIVAAAGERFDGSGGPLGMRGDAIPVGARIVAVADAFHRVASGHDVTMGHDAAYASVVRDAGSGFDPEIVAALLHAEDAPVATC